MAEALHLTLYPLEGVRDWEHRVAKVVTQSGYVWGERGRVWRADGRRELTRGVCYADGFRLSAVRLGERTHGLTINPHFYVFERTSGTPSDKPMWELLPAPAVPRLPAFSSRVDAQTAFHQMLANAKCGIAATPVGLQNARTGLLDESRLLAGPQASECDVTSPLGSILQKEGFGRVPPGLRILLCSPDGPANKVAIYSRYLEDAFGRIHVPCRINIVSWSELTGSVEERERRADSLVVLIGVHGRKGDPLTDATKSALAWLDERLVPYRMFSLENSVMKWSSFDQAGVIVAASGGAAYSLNLPAPADKSPLAYIGLDLGHPLKGERSWVVATVVDERGHLAAYWRREQKRDETLQRESLDAALSWVYLQLRKRYRSQCRVVVLRDGRMFENEDPLIYGQFFGDRYSLVEVIKHPVPLMLAGRDCAPPGTLCVPRKSDYAFLLTSRSKNHAEVNLPVKLRIVEDKLDLGLNTLAALIAGLSYAPSLGLSPTRAPSPIYWANGLAAIGSTNHQFSGVHWVSHN